MRVAGGDYATYAKLFIINFIININDTRFDIENDDCVITRF